MMRAIFYIFLFGWSSVAMGQSGFIKAYDESVEHSADFMDVVVDNDTIVLYSLAWDSLGNQGIRFSKIDSLGNVLQEAIFVDSVGILTTTAYRKKIIKTKDGGYAIFGSIGLPVYFLKVNHNLELEHLVKYVDSNGATLLNTTLMEVSDGFLLVGEYQDMPGAEIDVFVIKTDLQGNELWRKIYDDEVGVDEFIIEIKQVGDDFLLMGSKSQELGWQQSPWGAPYLLSIDSLGNMNWNWTMEKSKLPAGFKDGVMLEDSSWIFTSGSWEWNEDGGSYTIRPMVLRMDKDFNIVWQRVFGVLSGFQWFMDLEQTKDGQFIASGNLWHEWEDEIWYSRAVHYKFSAHGDSLWMRKDSVLHYAYVMGTDVMSTGSIVSVGYSTKKGPNGGVFGFVMKIGEDGCVDTLNCWLVEAVDDEAKPAGVEVFPNPVEEVLTIVIPPKTTTGTVRLYDALGRFLRKQQLNVGHNELIVSDLPQGMLFYEVWDTQKKVLIGRGRLMKE